MIWVKKEMFFKIGVKGRWQEASKKRGDDLRSDELEYDTLFDSVEMMQSDILLWINTINTK